MENTYQEILRQVNALPVIDTHEHLPAFEEYIQGERDLLNDYLSHYMSSDLISSGLKPDRLDTVRDSSLPVSSRWEIVEPYWEACRHTGYGRALDTAVQGIYGFDGIRKETIEALSEKYKECAKPGHYKHVLKDLCNIRLSILDAFDGGSDCDKTFFRRVWQPMNYIIPMPYTVEAGGLDVVSWLKKEYDITVKSLDDWMEAFCAELEDNLKKGIIGIKNTLAYFRTLKFEKVDYETAKNHFDSDFRQWDGAHGKEGKNISFSKEVQDFMMHFILSVLNKERLFIQTHTGLFEGNGNIITNGNPALMSNMFLEYPYVTFDIFHIGYPYFGETAALAKMFPNVFIDMCWAHIISPAASVQALGDFLDAVPYNKISAFGGDYLFVDGVYGHLQIARENVSRALAKKVENGVFSIAKAIEIAEHLFYFNPIRIFRLEEALEGKTDIKF